ncbi:MAG TPA: DUF4340 domain-containing protein, partial [Bacteroidales bacterium]|nr:DUF4340 domain-containing protein [Bacteroidales bacterium]
MNRKNKNGLYLIILLILAGIYVLLKYGINVSPDKNFDMSVLSIDTGKVASIKIKNPKDDNSLELKKESGIWYVLQGDKKEKADSNAITSILKVLADIKIQNVV